MRPYRTEEYKQKLIGNIFHDSGSDYKQYDGKKVQEIIRELTDKDYDRDELSADINKYGKRRYLIVAGRTSSIRGTIHVKDVTHRRKNYGICNVSNNAGDPWRRNIFLYQLRA